MADKEAVSENRISARQAVDSAVRYLTDILGRVNDVQVEEVDTSEDEKYWLTTLSFTPASGVPFGRKDYKIFKVDARTGEVKSMKIRRI